MPFPAPHYLFAFGGRLRTVDEQWTMGIRFSTDFFLSSQAAEEDMQAGLSAALGTWWPTGLSGAPAILDWTKFNRIGLDGRYERSYSNTYEMPTPVPGGSASNYPNQVAMVVTLETGVTRGLAHRGRLFFPVPRFNLDATTGKVVSGSMAGAATSAAGLINSLNDAAEAVAGAGAGIRAVVGSSTREGAFRAITGVTVGDVLDTMRSRRTQLEEVRAAAVVDAAT